MSNESSYQPISLKHDVQIARLKPTTALPLSTDDLKYFKDRIKRLKPNLNIFQSAGFFFIGSALACGLQAKFGVFSNPANVISTNEIVLWCMAGFCTLASIGCFYFCFLRYCDARQENTDLTEYITTLENKFESL